MGDKFTVDVIWLLALIGCLLLEIFLLAYVRRSRALRMRIKLLLLSGILTGCFVTSALLVERIFFKINF